MQMLKNSYAHKIGAKMNNLTLNGVRVKEQKKILKKEPFTSINCVKI